MAWHVVEREAFPTNSFFFFSPPNPCFVYSLTKFPGLYCPACMWKWPWWISMWVRAHKSNDWVMSRLFNFHSEHRAVQPRVTYIFFLINCEMSWWNSYWRLAMNTSFMWLTCYRFDAQHAFSFCARMPYLLQMLPVQPQNSNFVHFKKETWSDSLFRQGQQDANLASLRLLV